MWKKIRIDGAELLVKHCVNGTIHKILITNFIHLWYEDIQENDLLSRCKEMNKLVEATDDILLGHILSLVEGINGDITRAFCEGDSVKELNLQTSLEGFKFRMKFFLTLANALQFYEEVTSQLLTTISELEKRQHLLVEVIRSKDTEILEYKLEGGRISRKAVETVQFDLEAFSRKCAEDLSSTKSSVCAAPSHALTPFVQHLLHNISAAPVCKLANSHESTEEKEMKDEKNKQMIKLKSPRNKKIKMYVDEDSDGDLEQRPEDSKGGKSSTGDVKVKTEKLCLNKRKPKSKSQRLLPNL